MEELKAEYLEDEEDERNFNYVYMREYDPESRTIEARKIRRDDGSMALVLPCSDENDENSQVHLIFADRVSDGSEIIIGQPPRYTCETCGHTFKRLDSLYKHNNIHTGKTKCPVCNAVFSRVTHRTRHMRLKHPDFEIPYTNTPGRPKKTHTFTSEKR